MNSQITTIIVMLIIAFFSIKILNFIYYKFFESKKQLHTKFFKNLIKTIIMIIAIFKIGSQFDTFNTFTGAILTSSSLLVVVLGFAFQTSLEDFIAGVLISVFKPFNIDDRINLINSKIAGNIENITIRHTVIKTFTNSRLIIPNSIMNKEIIENNHMVDAKSSNFIDVTITYNSDRDLAKKIIKETIINHPKVIDTRSVDDKYSGVEQVTVFLKAFSPNGVELRASVWTNSIEDNFLACSEIREKIQDEFNRNNIMFASNETNISGNIKVNSENIK